MRVLALAPRILVVALAAGGGCEGKKRSQPAMAADAVSGAQIPSIPEIPPISSATQPAAPPSAAAAHGRPTAEECAMAVARMKQVAPALVEGDDEDRRACMVLPRAVVLCLHTIRGEAEAEACVASYAASRPALFDDSHMRPAAEELATLEECRRAIEHIEPLLPPVARDDETESGLLDECLRQFTKADVRCLLEARSQEEVDACIETE